MNEDETPLSDPVRLANAIIGVALKKLRRQAAGDAASADTAVEMQFLSHDTRTYVFVRIDGRLQITERMPMSSVAKAIGYLREISQPVIEAPVVALPGAETRQLRIIHDMWHPFLLKLTFAYNNEVFLMHFTPASDPPENTPQ